MKAEKDSITITLHIYMYLYHYVPTRRATIATPSSI